MGSYHTIPYSTSHTHTLSLSQYPRPTGWLAGWLQESSLLMTAVIILIYNNYEDDWYVNKRRKEEKNKRSVTLTANMIWSDLMTERERERATVRTFQFLNISNEYGNVSQMKNSSLHLHCTAHTAMTAPDYAPTFCGLRHISHVTIYGWRGVGWRGVR